MVRMEQDVVVGNVYDKYGSSNPVVRRIMQRFLRTFDELCPIPPAETTHEIGCGEGHLTARLAQRVKAIRATDISAELLQEAASLSENKQVEFEAKSIYDMIPDVDGADLVICCEVLEHLPDPHKAVKILAELANPFLLVSVPFEPWWRILNLCRLKYINTMGNTPGHIQHWSPRSFKELLRRKFEIIEFRITFPWLMALCRAEPDSTRGRH